jgi:transcriptional regulator with XRE-family HTH domain
MALDVNLLAELGLDANDPEVREAWEDAEAVANLVKTLVAARRHLGLSQRDVAERMGTTQSAVSDLERTAGDPRLSTLQRFGRAVGLKIGLAAMAPTPRYVSKVVIPVGRSESARDRTLVSRHWTTHVANAS